MICTGRIVDLYQRRIYPGHIVFDESGIKELIPDSGVTGPYIMPGFIDAHVHIESSMLLPTAFARMAVRHGTVATVSDPHEIANVLGSSGVHYMIGNARQTPFKVFFGAPSCVPATSFETAGATIDAAEIDRLLGDPDIWYLAEMMNYPGVLHQDPEVLAKIAAAQQHGKPVDGHAPTLTGDEAVRYIQAGISTDHECITLEEARFKALNGMKIIIREGSAAKNFTELIPLIGEYPDRIMFCSDDKHPDDLLVSHINGLVARAIGLGYDLYDVLNAACVNPVQHYQLPVGTLRPGEPADFILVPDLKNMVPVATFIGGKKVYERGQVLIDHNPPAEVPNAFTAQSIVPADLHLTVRPGEARVIHCWDGSLVTQTQMYSVPEGQTAFAADIPRDVLKIVVLNRYRKAPPAVALVHGFGLQKGAMASTVAHDSHNIIAVGTSDEAICRVIDELVRSHGGIAAGDQDSMQHLPLPVAGLIATLDGDLVAERYTAIDRYTKEALGCTLAAPFMTLSFLALLVIPQLKLSDLGLFDGQKFTFTEVMC